MPPIIGIGVDMVQISRMRDLITRNGERFLKRLFNDFELNQRPSIAEQHAQYFASRWAVKEATVKALGKGGIGSKCMYVDKCETTNVPKLVLTGAALNVLQDRNVHSYKSHLSISHDGDYAIAFVVLEQQEDHHTNNKNQ